MTLIPIKTYCKGQPRRGALLDQLFASPSKSDFMSFRRMRKISMFQNEQGNEPLNFFTVDYSKSKNVATK